ncbi:hypothetical protein, partial [Alistipes finegoldii]|uniref:hypothetical protein n=1 Tax=Alistipes finegoldii TaxID=214856 RepID=UPI00241F2A06
YRSPGEDDFSVPEPEREAQPTGPGLSFPKATDWEICRHLCRNTSLKHTDIGSSKIYRNTADRIFLSAVFRR